MAGQGTKRGQGSREARKEAFLPVMRQLVRTYQAFERFDAAPLGQYGLTPPQADVVFTLGNTPGMTFKELGEKTLITKGTLTGIVDRLEAKKLVRRQASEGDRRCIRVTLTAKGDTLFQKAFPAHVAYLKPRFDRLGPAGLRQAREVLERIESLFE